MDRTTVLVVYPQSLLRQALCALVGSFAGVERVLAADGGQNAARIARSSRCATAVIGGSPPEGSLAQVCRMIVEAAPGIRVLVLMPPLPGTAVLDVLRAGARACLADDAGKDEMEAAMRVVGDGGTHISTTLVEEMALRVRSHLLAPGSQVPSAQELSAREEEVLRLTGEGVGNSAIARQLGLSVKTVEAHKARIAQKLGIRGSVALLKHAIIRGLVDLEPAGQPQPAQVDAAPQPR